MLQFLLPLLKQQAFLTIQDQWVTFQMALNCQRLLARRKPYLQALQPLARVLVKESVRAAIKCAIRAVSGTIGDDRTAKAGPRLEAVIVGKVSL